MFIKVRNQVTEEIIINSAIIKNVSVEVEPSKPNKDNSNGVDFRICIEDFDGNIYYAIPESSFKNERNVDLNSIKGMIISTMEELLNGTISMNRNLTGDILDELKKWLH